MAEMAKIKNTKPKKNDSMLQKQINGAKALTSSAQSQNILLIGATAGIGAWVAHYLLQT